MTAEEKNWLLGRIDKEMQVARRHKSNSKGLDYLHALSCGMIEGIRSIREIVEMMPCNGEEKGE